jgi:hypothetical protein
LVIWIKRFMLTLCKQGVLVHEMPLKRERCITPGNGPHRVSTISGRVPVCQDPQPPPPTLLPDRKMTALPDVKTARRHL